MRPPIVFSSMADDALAEFCRAEWPRLVGSLSLFTTHTRRALTALRESGLLDDHDDAERREVIDEPIVITRAMKIAEDIG